MKQSVYWLLAIVITLVLSVYQRMTGPTHPKRVTVELNGESFQQKLPRSGVQQDEIVILKELPEDAIVQLHYRRFPVPGRQPCPSNQLPANCSIISPSMARLILPRSRC